MVAAAVAALVAAVVAVVRRHQQAHQAERGDGGQRAFLLEAVQSHIGRRAAMAQERCQFGAPVGHVKHLHRRAECARREQHHDKGQRVGQLDGDHVTGRDAVGAQSGGGLRGKPMQRAIRHAALAVRQGERVRPLLRPARNRFVKSPGRFVVHSARAFHSPAQTPPQPMTRQQPADTIAECLGLKYPSNPSCCHDGVFSFSSRRSMDCSSA